jgi:acetyltransferase-like isoleucine patch superfamily enzyme
MRKLRLVLAVFICVLPFNFLRVFAYKFILGYKITDAKIGFGTIIAVDKAEIAACKIGWGNLFTGPMTMKIGEEASIGYRNTFSCGYWTTRPEYTDANYARNLLIAEKTLITSQHYIDVAGAFTLGAGSWIAGFSSQFWTHGAGIIDRDISIGKNCYLGSAVRFAPGATIGNDILVAMGSVVTNKFDIDYAMLGGVPAKVLKENYHWQEKAP